MKINLLVLVSLVYLLCFKMAVAQVHPATTAPEQHSSLVKWLSLKEAQALNKTNPKPFLIDVYTDWCGWCKHMMKTTYSNPNIANYINQWYYPVQLDAETHDTIYYRDTMYVNTGTLPRAQHQLAIKLLGPKQSYPTTIFQFDDFKKTSIIPGFLDAQKIEPILIYFVENIWMNASFDDFNKYFNIANYDTAKLYKKVALKKYNFNEALLLNKTTPKKLLVNINADFCNGCNVMLKHSFADSVNVAYLNQNFYLIDFNVAYKDSIKFQNYVFKNDGSNGTNYHQMAFAFTNNNLVLPSTVVIDEQLKPLEVLPRYITAQNLAPILRFYGSNAYLTKNWQQFTADYFKK
jgi:thioredoxin-related protein